MYHFTERNVNRRRGARGVVDSPVTFWYPPRPMRIAETIAIGSELLVGGKLDSNSLFVAEQLGTLGLELRFKTVVGDAVSDIVAAIRVAAKRADVVVMTGGLGPTVDDRTRDAVAKVTGRPLRRHSEALDGMSRRLAAWGRTPSKTQLRQAVIPRGADVLPNPVGSAPGFVLSWKGSWLAALPGVPSEAREMMTTALVPRLRAALGRRVGRPIVRYVIHTFGRPESEVDAMLADVLLRPKTIQLGLLASPNGVSVSLTAPGGPPERLVTAVRERLGVWAYATGEERMEQVVGRLLMAQGLTIAVAESCTGGLIGHRLTEVAGSSGYLDRAVVCYANRAKVELLGVPDELIREHGAVSAPVAAAMAEGIRLRSRVGVGLSVTGIAGPGGGTDTKPVGLVYIGLSAGPFRAGTRERAALNLTKEHRFHGERSVIKWRASQAALDLLRRWLLKVEPFEGHHDPVFCRR